MLRDWGHVLVKWSIEPIGEIGGQAAGGLLGGVAWAAWLDAENRLATKKPKTIDRTTTEDPGKGTTTLGIYEIDGDTLKICSAQPGTPTEFTSKKGSGHVLSVWEREKK